MSNIINNTKNNNANGLIVIHHTGVAGNNNLPSINTSHKRRFFDELKLNKQPLGRVKAKLTKYPYIAYHYIILKDGTIIQNRGLEQIGYHAGHYPTNISSIAICLEGNFELETPSLSQYQSLDVLLNGLVNEEGAVVKKIVGHKDISPTLCPGKNLYDSMKTKVNFIKNNMMSSSNQSQSNPNQSSQSNQSSGNNMGFYEKVFVNEYGGKSTIYDDILRAINNLGVDKELIYFILIGLERAKKS